MTSENPLGPVHGPGVPPAPGPVVSQPQIACPNCFTIVAPGTAYCPNCSGSIPPPWPGIPAAPPPRKPRTLLIIGIVLLVLLVLGGVGTVVYLNIQQQQQRENQLVLQAAKNTEQNAANQAPDQFTITCFTATNDTSHLSYSQYTGYAGYARVYETFGISNPTKFSIDATWTLTFSYPSVGWVLTSSIPFHLAANGVAYPTFTFQIDATQYNNLPSNPDFTQYNGAVDGTYTLTGTYAAYSVTQHSTFDSTTNAGGSSPGSTNNLSKC